MISIILRKYLRELRITRKIAKRDNFGGIRINMTVGSHVLTKVQNSMHMYIPFEPSNFSILIKDLLVGKE